MGCEIEVLELLGSLVYALKPSLVVETGSYVGYSAFYMGSALAKNRFGHLISCEVDEMCAAQARVRCQGLPVEVRITPSLELDVDGPIDLLFCDSVPALRPLEIRKFFPQISNRGLIVVHDTNFYPRSFEALRELERGGLLYVLYLPTPRGLAIAQRTDRIVVADPRCGE
jgi:predicted O-methyltransferase YrrM